jgi:hypothetical protein
MVALPDKVFARVISTATLDKMMRLQQRNNQHKIEEWKEKYHLSKGADGAWYRASALVMVGEDEDC